MLSLRRQLISWLWAARRHINTDEQEDEEAASELAAPALVVAPAPALLVAPATALHGTPLAIGGHLVLGVRLSWRSVLIRRSPAAWRKPSALPARTSSYALRTRRCSPFMPYVPGSWSGAAARRLQGDPCKQVHKVKRESDDTIKRVVLKTASLRTSLSSLEFSSRWYALKSDS